MYSVRSALIFTNYFVKKESQSSLGSLLDEKEMTERGLMVSKELFKKSWNQQVPAHKSGSIFGSPQLGHNKDVSVVSRKASNYIFP